METQKTVIQAKPVTLSSDDQEAVIAFVKDAWDKGKSERKKYVDHAKECRKAYHCEREPITSPELDWMSNKCLPWAYDAAESWYAHIHSTTIPKNDQIFTVSGRTEEDHPGADVMQKYLEFRFERNFFARQLGMAMKNLVIENHACLKVYWREDVTVESAWEDEPVIETLTDPSTGQAVPSQVGTRRVIKPKERTTFNNVWIDVVDLDNFVMYPIRGDFEKSTRIHETYRYYEDLMASAENANYVNLDQITLDDERGSDNASHRTEADSLKKSPKGLNIKEAWIHRVKIGDKVYRNYVATIVNDKTLIRFQPFPPDCQKSPFVFLALRPDGDCFYGYGLNSKGLDILEAANEKFNGWLDEGKLTQHEAWKYYDDGVFNPNNVVRRPGAMVKMSQQSIQDNLVPLTDNLAPQQQVMQDLALLKVEFETVTVPKVVKGMIEVGRDATATEINQAQSNSSGKMHIDAFHINDGMLAPTLEKAYQAIYERAQFDESVQQEILQVTQPKDADGNPMNELPLLPLPEVDIKVVGYQNVIRKQETLAAIGQAVPQFAQSPAGKYLQWPNLLEDVFGLMDLDKKRLIMDDAARKQVDETERQAAEQQQQLLVQEATAKLQLQKEKQDQDFQIKLQELELRRLELGLKFQQQEHSEAVAGQELQMKAQGGNNDD